MMNPRHTHPGISHPGNQATRPERAPFDDPLARRVGRRPIFFADTESPCVGEVWYHHAAVGGPVALRRVGVPRGILKLINILKIQYDVTAAKGTTQQAYAR